MNIATRAMFLAGALVLSHPLAIVLAYPWFPTGVRVEGALVLLTSLVQPAIGLLVVAVIAPLGELMFPLLRAQPPRHAELVVIAFLVGWLAARAFAREDGPALPRNLRLAVWIFGAIIVASVATTMLQYRRADPQRFHDLWQSFRGAYLWSDDPIGVHAAMNLLEGLGVMTAAAWVVRRRERYAGWIPLALVAGGVASAVATVLLAVGVAPAATLVRQAAFGAHRYSAAMADLNAAGSYYLLALAVSLGVAATSRPVRIVMLAASALIGAAAILTGSRAALVAIAITAVALGAIGAMPRIRSRRTAIAVVAVAALVLLVALAKMPSVAASVGMRTGFLRAGFNLIAARPVFGVGEGRFLYVSSIALPPPLAWAYGQENAHNYFLQTAAELGLTGFGAFLWLLGGVFGAARSRVAGRPLTAALAAGAAGYLLTCAVGHPFLVAEAATPFWIVAGLMSAAGVHVAGERRWSYVAAAAVVIVVAASVPVRARTSRLGLSTRDDGLGGWQTDRRGSAYRESTSFASVFLDPAIEVVEIPVRAGDEGAKAVVVQVALAGTSARDAILVGRNWAAFRVRQPPLDPLLPRWRVNLAVIRAPGEPPGDLPVMYVGRLKIEPGAPQPVR